MRMYKYSFLDHRERMAIAAPVTATQTSASARAPRTRVAVAGATGYAGQELVRLLARHPAVTLTAAMSSGATSTPRPLPALARIWDEAVMPLDIDHLVSSADIVFLALPEAASADVAPKLLERGTRVIDLSGAFRIRDAADRQRWYPTTPSLPAGTVYGLPERTVIVDAKSGISGAGKAPSDRTHFSENHGSVAAYGVFSHRHNAEIEQELKREVTFVPHLVPLDRGILETIYVSLKRGTTEAQVAQALEDAYRDAAFVRLTGAALPEIKHVAHTNFCDIGWKVDDARGRLVLIAVLDNLVKGAAGQAVQNLNIVLGLDERTGLL